MPLLQVKNLNVALPPGADRPLAVEDVSLEIERNQIVRLRQIIGRPCGDGPVAAGRDGHWRQHRFRRC